MFSSFQYSDAWFMNESLAFYTSTNTFSNPIFDRDLESSAPGDDVMLSTNNDIISSTIDEDNFSKDKPGACISEQKRTSSRFSFRSFGLKKSASKPIKKANQYESNKNRQEKFSNFCDNLVISIKGKAFVLELNLKRRLIGLKKFLDKNLPWILPSKPQYSNNTRNNYGFLNNTNNFYHNGASSTKRFFQKRTVAAIDEKIHFDDSQIFWHSIQPSSTESLEAQQVRLLNRLEKAKRDNQKLFNLERGGNFRKKFNQAAKRTIDETGCSSEDYSIASPVSGYSRKGSSSTNTSLYHKEMRPGYQGFTWCPKNAHETSDWIQSSASSNDEKKILNGARSRKNSTCSRPSEPNNQQSSLRRKSERILLECTSANVTTAPTIAPNTRASSIAEKQKSRWILSGKQIKLAANHALIGSRSKQLCIVCYANTPNIVTLPCEHHDICSDCFIEIIYMAVKNSQYPLKCVLCRQKVERIKCSRKLLLQVSEKSRSEVKKT